MIAAPDKRDADRQAVPGPPHCARVRLTPAPETPARPRRLPIDGARRRRQGRGVDVVMSVVMANESDVSMPRHGLAETEQNRECLYQAAPSSHLE